jgi:molecular chaperone GrpE
MASEDVEKEVADGADEESAKDKAQEAQENMGKQPDSSESPEQESNSEVDEMIEEAVEEALAEQQDMVLRAQAEVQNMQRRCEQDVERAHKFALEKFSGELLTVIDNLERALQAVPDIKDEKVKALYEGVELTLKGFVETLEKFNIEQVDPEGEPFDPQQHEAISLVENDDVDPNTVLTVVQKGYLLHGRVIRPAMVMVSKASGK